jgi:hypothetical protein
MPPVKIVFLDIDGVLNSHEYVRERAPENERASIIGIDRIAVVRLNRLLRETRAEVVVSSTKRARRTRAQLAEMLEDRGFVGVVRGMTPDHVVRTPGGLYAADRRGHEIQAWLEAAPRYGVDVESFVILDDDSDMAHLADRHVKTAFETGLTEADVDRAIAMLRAPSPLIVLPPTGITV